MSREINRLTTLFVLGFAVMMLGTAYWSLIESDNLRQREDNPRRVLAELNIERGTIFDRNGGKIAYTDQNGNLTRRVYPYPEVVGAVGYYSYTFGAAGLEEGMNAWLNGDAFDGEWANFGDDLIHAPIEGGDIQTTLDTALQQELATLMQDQNGGAIVVHIPSGEIWAMVSQPTYDPNHIEEEHRLQTHLNFLPRNRVTQRFYQPGGILQTLILSEFLAAGVSLDTAVSLKPIELTDSRLVLTCLNEQTELTFTLAQAYLNACPAPFVNDIGTQIASEALFNKFQAVGLLDAPRLDGFLLETTPPNVLLPTSEAASQAEFAGQGDLTVTPLQAVQIMASVVNNGNGVPLHLISATRPPDETKWESFTPTTPHSAMMQPAVALQIYSLLQENPLAENLYGHLSRAYAGSRQYIWFLGWTSLDNGDSLLMVLVLEGKDITPQTALAIAQNTLRSLP